MENSTAISVVGENKCEFVDLNARFLCYINKVRQLRNEDDTRNLNENVSILEEQLRIMKESYETQISQLSTNLDIVVSQKVEIGRNMSTCDDSLMRLADRLAIENAGATHLLFQQSCLIRDLAAKDKESKSISLTLEQLKQAGSASDIEDSRLLRDFDNSCAKSARLEDQIRNFENNISDLTQKIKFQDHSFSKKLEDMEGNLEEQTQRMVRMDSLISAAKEHERQRPLILEGVRRSGKERYLKYKSEAEEYFQGRMSYIQGMLDAEIADNVSLTRENGDLDNECLQMRRMEAELRSKEEHLERRKGILEEALQRDKDDSGRTIFALESKIKTIQDDFVREKEEKVSSAQEVKGVQIKGEIAFLRELLEEEERRLHIRTREWEQERGSEDKDKEACGRVLREDNSVDKPYQDQEALETREGGGRAGHEKDECRRCTINSGEHTASHSFQLLNGPKNETEAEASHCPAWSPQHARESTSGSGSSSLGSSRSKTDNRSHKDFGQEENPESRKMATVVSGEGRHTSRMSDDDQSKKATTIEVDPHGRYIRLSNLSDSQAAYIGLFTIEQSRFGHPVALFRFPTGMTVAANSFVNIWAGSNDPMCHHPPSDFYCEEPAFWGSGPEYTTVMRYPLGEVFTCSAQEHMIYKDPYRARTAHISHKGTRKEDRTKLPELTSNRRTVLSEQPFLERYDDNTLSHPIYHPYTSTPKSSIHPCIENNRGKTAGNDNSSFNRQTRQQQDGVPDPMIGQPYTGNSAQRMMGSARVMRLGRRPSSTLARPRAETSKPGQLKEHFRAPGPDSGAL